MGYFKPQRDVKKMCYMCKECALHLFFLEIFGMPARRVVILQGFPFPLTCSLY